MRKQSIISLILGLSFTCIMTGCGKSSAKSSAEKSSSEHYEESLLSGFDSSASGLCGADLSWEYSRGLLTISGTGEMQSDKESYK